MEDTSDMKDADLNGEEAEMAMSYLDRVRNKLKCSFCYRAIGRGFFTQCAICDQIYLCADCFAAEVRLPPHEPSHAYRIADCMETPLFAKDWTCKDELLLFDLIEKHGMGNWKIISESLENNRTAKQVEDHYWELYMGTHGYCLPSSYLHHNEVRRTLDLFPQDIEDLPEVSPTSLGLTNTLSVVEQHERYYEERLAGDLYRIAVNPTHTRGEVVHRDSGGRDGRKGEIQSKLATLVGADLPGYMPLREDFDVEYENDAEQVLANMEFNLDEHPSETELKLQILRIYNRKLRERNERKAFVIERGLIDFKTQQQKEKRLTKEERELVAKFRVFARFMSGSEWDTLVEGVLKAHRLRLQIELYKHYQALGLRSLEEVQAYETNKKQEALASRLRKQSVSYLPSAAQHLVQPSAQREKSLGGEEGETPGGEGKKKRGRPPRLSSSSSSQLSSQYGGSSGASVAEEGGMKRTRRGDSRVEGKEQEEESGQSPLKASLSMEEIDAAPLARLLSEEEKTLCCALPLLPAHYLAIKEALLREAHRTGLLTVEGVRRIGVIEEEKAGMVLDFFVKDAMSHLPESIRTQK